MGFRFPVRPTYSFFYLVTGLDIAIVKLPFADLILGWLTSLGRGGFLLLEVRAIDVRSLVPCIECCRRCPVSI